MNNEILTYKEFLIEAALDGTYKKLINSLVSLKWDSKPRKAKASAGHELSGSINGKYVTFSWHQPDKYGSGYAFTGLLYGSDSKFGRAEEMFATTWMDLEDSPDDEKLVKANIKEFEKAISFVKKL